MPQSGASISRRRIAPTSVKGQAQGRPASQGQEWNSEASTQQPAPRARSALQSSPAPLGSDPQEAPSREETPSPEEQMGAQQSQMPLKPLV